MFYSQMIAEDEIQEMERNRDYIEYLARFIDNESVERIQRARESKIAADDEAFNKLLEQKFGKGLGSRPHGGQ